MLVSGAPGNRLAVENEGEGEGDTRIGEKQALEGGVDLR